MLLASFLPATTVKNQPEYRTGVPKEPFGSLYQAGHKSRKNVRMKPIAAITADYLSGLDLQA